MPEALPAPTATASAAVPSATPAGSPAAGAVTSLRVRERPVSSGPIDSILHWLFGGFFGW
ncbi:MAG: hypothetical protein ABSE70_01255 [Candidatus Limnocylindrales bacterium]